MTKVIMVFYGDLDDNDDDDNIKAKWPGEVCKHIGGRPGMPNCAWSCHWKVTSIFIPIIIIIATITLIFIIITTNITIGAYMQKTCDVVEKAILGQKNLRKKCVNRDKM